LRRFCGGEEREREKTVEKRGKRVKKKPDRHEILLTVEKKMGFSDHSFFAGGNGGGGKNGEETVRKKDAIKGKR